MLELCYSENSVFWIHSNFTYDFENYDIVKVYSDLLNLVYCILNNFSNLFNTHEWYIE